MAAIEWRLVETEEEDVDKDDDDVAPAEEVDRSGCELTRVSTGDDVLEDWLSDEVVVLASAAEARSVLGRPSFSLPAGVSSMI
jgi:hypothetical protein